MTTEQAGKALGDSQKQQQQPKAAAAAAAAAPLRRQAASELSAWLHDTNAHGFGQCARSRSVPARLLWVLCIATCFSLATYHVLALVRKYADYPTTLTMRDSSLPPHLPDPVVCSSDLPSRYRVSRLSDAEWLSLEADFRRLWNLTVKTAEAHRDVDYVLNFKRLFYRTPRMLRLMPLAQDVVLGFTYGSGLRGGPDDFRRYLADVNGQLMLCFRLSVSAFLRHRGVDRNSFSRNSLKLLLYKKPKSARVERNSMDAELNTNWSRTEALPLLLRESGEDGLRLFLVGARQPLNSAESLASGVLMTHGRHYDVRLVNAKYKIDKSFLDCSEGSYFVKDAVRNFSAIHGSSTCRQFVCAQRIAQLEACSHCGIVEFETFATTLPNCCDVSDSPSDAEFLEKLNLLKRLGTFLRFDSVCNGSREACAAACGWHRNLVEADAYSWPHLSAAGPANYSSEVRTLQYLREVLRQLEVFLPPGVTSEIVDEFPNGTMPEAGGVNGWHMIRVFVSYASDSAQSYEISRKFEPQDFLSDFGGALGVWIGASFLTAGEIVILAASLLRLLLLRRQQRATGGLPADFVRCRSAFDTESSCGGGENFRAPG